MKHFDVSEADDPDSFLANEEIRKMDSQKSNKQEENALGWTWEP